MSVTGLLVERVGTGVCQVGPIRSIKIPAGWIEGSGKPFSLGQRYVIPFHPPDDDDSELCLFYRGLPIPEEDSSVFRKYLQGAHQVLFSEDTTSINDSTQKSITQLREVLGNTNNNQVLSQFYFPANYLTDEQWAEYAKEYGELKESAKEQAEVGHWFHLRRAEITSINGSSVLSVVGWYRDPKTHLRESELWKIFIDGDHQSPECPVLEVFLSTETIEQFNKYCPIFQETLNTIEWQ